MYPYRIPWRSLTSIAVQMITVAFITIQRDNQHHSVNNAHSFRDNYDYIVVGAGSSGCPVARRLSDRGYSVLLLEAGPVQSFITDVPGVEQTILRDNPQYNWAFSTVPQRKIGLSRTIPGVLNEDKGRVLGGSSTINSLVWLRPNPRDMDNWVHKYGATGWSWAETLPIFNRLENNSDYQFISQNPEYHGTHGPIGVMSVNAIDNFILDQVRQSYNSVGIPIVDLNGPTQLGTNFVQLSIEDGWRESSANAYLDPNPNPHNLYISTDSYVTQILIDDVHGKPTATGVQFDVTDAYGKRQTYKVRTNKEVVLSAGSYGSPHLLMLSGIGPKSHLTKFGIKPIVDLPVGYNLQDHVQVSIDSLIKDPQQFLNDFPELTTEKLYQLIKKNMGPLGSSPVVYTYINTKSNANEPEWPNVVLSHRFLQFSTNLTELIEIYSREQLDEWEQYYFPLLGAPYLSSEVFVRRTRSFGRVWLMSEDPYVLPAIDPNYFADDRDFEDMLEAFKFLINFLQNSAISEYINFMHTPVPPCASLLCMDRPFQQCDEYLRCYITQIGFKEHHSVGTCRMGDPHRKDTVLDPKLKVKGVDGLRVCDASVMPRLPNANINVLSIMIGEKCADIINSGY
ncbi:L-sorbose 1-dehydrogenase-like [Oppia nitens]|uniref:L-sorbose 1-dehydrogenase-like n=1 Tax=Oppia nitens TaxID=1686743 RepID=UPI0023D9CAFD|nr:L-sorbose 1-dehydrogenase-like [Oppia nitens]